MDRTVLCYIEHNDRYLLIHRTKKKNDINEGKYFGVGGHIEEGETPEDALIREVKEEAGLALLSFKKHGIVYFEADGYKEEMHLFTSKDFSGELIECDEGDLLWVDIEEVTTLPCWEGDKIFLNYIANDEPYFELELVYNKDKLVSATRLK